MFAFNGYFSLSISKLTRVFKIYAMFRERASAEIFTIRCKKNWRPFVLFLMVWSVIDNEFRHNIVKVVFGSPQLSPSTATLTTLWLNSWSMTERMKTADVELLILHWRRATLWLVRIKGIAFFTTVNDRWHILPYKTLEKKHRLPAV